jgi:hypothetical protein
MCVLRNGHLKRPYFIARFYTKLPLTPSHTTMPTLSFLEDLELDDFDRGLLAHAEKEEE